MKISKFLGLFKKLKETAGKGIEKGVELGTKGYDAAMESAKKGIEKARTDTVNDGNTQIPIEDDTPNPATSTENKKSSEKNELSNIDPDALAILKLRFVKGEITAEEFEEMKSALST